MENDGVSLNGSDHVSEVVLEERMPGKTLAEYVALGVVIGVTINGFILVTTYTHFDSGEVLIPLGFHLIASTAVTLLMIWGWKLNHLENHLIVRPKDLEYTAGGHSIMIQRLGAVVRMSHIRSPSANNNQVVIESQQNGVITLPEELTGSPERFLDLLEAHGWLVVRPAGWEGRLY